MKKLLSIIFILCVIIAPAQNENNIVDSILNIIEHSNDKQKVRQFLTIGQLTRNMNLDTAYYYDSIGLTISRKMNDDSLLVLSYINIALDYKQYGKLKKAKKYFAKSLNLALNLKDSANLSSIYNNLGVIAADQGKYDEALKSYMLALEINEIQNNKRALAIAYNNIGIIHFSMENIDLAMVYYKKAIKINQLIGHKNSEALQLMNIGILHYYKDNYDSVFYYFKSALKIWESNGNLRNLAMIQSNLAEMHIELHEYDEAIEYLTSAKNIYTQLKEVFDVINTDLLIGEIQIKNGDFSKAIEIFNEALKKAQQAESLTEEMIVYRSFHKLYKEIGEYKKAYGYYEKYSTLKDTIFVKERTNTIQEMETKYQTEKIQQQLILSEKENKLIELEKKRLQLIIYFILLIALLLIVLIAFIVRAYRVKKRAFNTISKQNKEIRAQRNEIAQQRDHANEQKEVIQKQNEAITDSINYAQRIQKAIIPSDNEIKQLINDYFVFYLPKDVVSGDFYWISKIHNRTIISVADCTGHGVPGAFMSMLGISFLNEIAKTNHNSNAANILDKLRGNIIESLRQNETGFEQIDGMDMAIVILNDENNTIEFAGARNSLYVLSDNEIIPENKETKIKILEKEGCDKKLYEVAADRMPVAKYLKMSQFNNHKIALKSGDQIVMYSDGFTDQFGGVEGEKFQTANFKSLLLNNSNKPLKDQQKIITEEYHKWKGEHEQIDDVSIFSFKI